MSKEDAVTLIRELKERLAIAMQEHDWPAAFKLDRALEQLEISNPQAAKAARAMKPE